jgi:uncharacterized coiled-coil protein SlyX
MATEETATISLKRLFEYQEKIAQLEEVVKHQESHLLKISDALTKMGFTVIVSEDNRLKIIRTTDNMFDISKIINP